MKASYFLVLALVLCAALRSARANCCVRGKCHDISASDCASFGFEFMDDCSDHCGVRARGVVDGEDGEMDGLDGEGLDGEDGEDGGDPFVSELTINFTPGAFKRLSSKFCREEQKCFLCYYEPLIPTAHPQLSCGTPHCTSKPGEYRCTDADCTVVPLS